MVSHISTISAKYSKSKKFKKFNREFFQNFQDHLNPDPFSFLKLEGFIHIMYQNHRILLYVTTIIYNDSK